MTGEQPVERSSHSVGVQAIALAVGGGLAQVVVALLYVLAARDAGPAEYGVIAAAIALGSGLIGFIDFGSNSLLGRELAAARLDPADYANRAATKLAIAAGVAAAGAVVFAFLSPANLVACLVGPAILTLQTLLVPLRAAKRGVLVAVIGLVERGAAAIVFGVLVAASISATVALWVSLTAGTAIAAVVALWATPRASRFTSARRFANPWRGSFFYGVSGLAASGQQLDLPVLSAVAGVTASGIYAGVNRWTQPMGLLASSFSSAAIPFIASAPDWRSTFRVAARAGWLLLAAIAVCILMAVFAPIIVPWLLGHSFADSAVVLQILAVGTIPAILNQPMYAALQARGLDRVAALIYLAAVVAQLGLIVILGVGLGALGAAIAFCVLQGAMLVAFALAMVRAYRAEIGGESQ